MVNVLAEGQLASGLGAAFERCDTHEVLLHGDGDGLRHLGEEGNDALEHADEDRALTPILLGDLRANLADALVDIFFRDENSLNVLHHVKLVNHSVTYPLSLS